MKIEIKSFKFYERLSEETNAFTAELYVNGVKAAHVKNDGQGGNTFYHAYENKRELIKQAEAYCKSLPSVKCGNYTFDMNLEFFIDNEVEKLIAEKDKEKFNKKKEKDMLKGILIETEKGYSLLSWKGYTLENLLRFEKGKQLILNEVTKLRSEGKVILNTNIPMV